MHRCGIGERVHFERDDVWPTRVLEQQFAVGQSHCSLRGLNDSSNPCLPAPRITLAVIDRDDRDLVRINTLEDSIRKLGHDHAPQSWVDFGGRFRQAAYVVEHGLHAEYETLPQPG